ncbi:MAG: hypothetical protein FWG42_04780, partial [Clostridiales bacterium]|nr:hypothetical protein [Clostridiales bacterium]
MNEILFYCGIIICSVTTICAIIAIAALRFVKIRINRQFDAEYEEITSFAHTTENECICKKESMGLIVDKYRIID